MIDKINLVLAAPLIVGIGSIIYGVVAEDMPQMVFGAVILLIWSLILIGGLLLFWIFEPKEVKSDPQ